MEKKIMFLPIITHLVDQISDIGVAVEFGILANKTTPDQCGVNMCIYLY